MNSDPTNPYAPPNPVASQNQARRGAMESLRQLGSIPFAGRIRRRELDEYLRADGHVGGARLAILAMGFGGIFFVLAFLGIPFLAVSVGAMGILTISLIVSTLPYRRLMFTNANPDWEQAMRGSIQPEGIRLNREHSSTFYRWNWFGETVTSPTLVALQPATQAAAPLMIARDMIPTEDAWELLRQVTDEVGATSNRLETEDLRRDQNLRILKDQQRGWTFTPPPDAIAFEGIVWSDDFNLLPRPYQARVRPLRTHLVIYGLVTFMGLILAGCSGLLFKQIAILPVIVTIYLVAAIAIGRRRRRSSGEVIFYLQGYALESSLVTDFGLAVSETTWPGLAMLANHEHHIVLRRCGLNNFVVIRKDMFADQNAWDRFRQLVSDNLAGIEGTP